MQTEEIASQQAPAVTDDSATSQTDDQVIDAGNADSATETTDNTQTPKPTEKQESDPKAIRELKEQRRKRQEAERREAYLQGQLDALKKPVEEAKPDATLEKPRPEKYATYEEYTEAVADWKADQKIQAEKTRMVEERRQHQEQERVQSVRTKLTTAAEKFPEIQDIFSDATFPISQAMTETIIESDLHGEILSFFAKNPEEARRIYKLSPLGAAREIGKIEAKMSTAPAADTKPNIPTAPAPITPQGGGGGHDTGDPAKMSDEEWLKAERARVKKLGRLY